MSATIFSLQALAKEEEELPVSRLASSSMLVSDSKLSWNGFVKLKTQSFLQLLVN